MISYDIYVLISDDKEWFFQLEPDGFECVIRIEDAFQCHRKKDIEALLEYANHLDSNVCWSIYKVKYWAVKS